MDNARTEQPVRVTMTRAHHAGGVLLLAASLLCLSLLPYLPTRAAHSTVLPFLQDREGEVVLAYAGFAGCGDTCPRGLATLAAAYDLHTVSGSASLDLLFINVQRHAPAESTRAFAQAFHERFQVYTIGNDVAEYVYDELSLRSFDDNGRAAYHSDYVYVFTRHADSWRIERVYRQFPTIERLVADLRQLSRAA